MKKRPGAAVGLWFRGYTRRVSQRLLVRAVGCATLAVGIHAVTLHAFAEPATKTPPTEVARAVGQAAQATAEATEEFADTQLPAPSPADPNAPLQNARDGVVVLERAGKPIGIGTVLGGDGRILTALSSLGHGNGVDARFSDGSVTRVKVGHTDRAWDLALLLPQNGRWTKGLKASRVSATNAGTGLRSFSLVGAKELAPARTIVRGRTTLLGGDSELLHDALDLASRFKPTDVGSPVLDDRGDVVAVVARACLPNSPDVCSPVPFGVPVSAVKAFLRTVPAHALPPAPWLGIQGAAADVGPVRGVRVLDVHPKSPAAAAGLRGGAQATAADVVVAVDGVPVTTPELLGQSVAERAVGDSVRLLVFGGGKYREVSLTLRAAPDAGGAEKALPARAAPAAPAGAPEQSLAPRPKRPYRAPGSRADSPGGAGIR